MGWKFPTNTWTGTDRWRRSISGSRWTCESTKYDRVRFFVFCCCCCCFSRFSVVGIYSSNEILAIKNESALEREGKLKKKNLLVVPTEEEVSVEPAMSRGCTLITDELALSGTPVPCRVLSSTLRPGDCALSTFHLHHPLPLPFHLTVSLGSSIWFPSHWKGQRAPLRPVIRFCTPTCSILSLHLPFFFFFFIYTSFKLAYCRFNFLTLDIISQCAVPKVRCRNVRIIIFQCYFMFRK